MIPKQMEKYLQTRLPEATFNQCMIKENNMCFMEFSYMDVQNLSRIGISKDKMGPRMVVCMWDEKSPLEIGCYLVIDNLAMGRPAMGGIKIMPDISPAEIFNLARAITYKNGAANLPFGGAKCGIVYPDNAKSEDRKDIIRGFARLIKRYKDLYIPCQEKGFEDEDVKTIIVENGIDSILSKPQEMGGNSLDRNSGIAHGITVGLQTLLEIMPRLKELSQFKNLSIPPAKDITILIQGFGSIGTRINHFVKQKLPNSKIIGISDIDGYLFDINSLPIDQLYEIWNKNDSVTKKYYSSQIMNESGSNIVFSNRPDDLLREDAFCMIPASPIYKYIDIIESSEASVSINKMGDWSAIIEGADTFSINLNDKAQRSRMEQAVYRKKGVLIVTDYLVNSGSEIFAAQEKLLKTPQELQIPENMIGNESQIDKWLNDHSKEYIALANERKSSAQEMIERNIRRNIYELVETLVNNPEMLPSEAAERISIQRIAATEKKSSAADVMESIPKIGAVSSIQQAASLLVEKNSSIIAVISPEDKLVGVVTAWDITRAIAQGFSTDIHLEEIMTQQVISTSPSDSILEIVRVLEKNKISAIPVVEGGSVLGMVNSDLLAHKYLLQLLQTQ